MSQHSRQRPGRAARRAPTVAELLRARGIERPRGVAVAVNGAVVPARRLARRRALAAGDEIEIVRPFGGG